MLGLFRKRYPKYLLIAAVLLIVWLAAGEIVSGSNPNGYMFYRDQPVVSHPAKGCLEESEEAEDSHPEIDAQRGSNEKIPKDPQEDDGSTPPLSQNGVGDSFLPEDGPELGCKTAGPANTAGLEPPEVKSASSSPLPTDTGSSPPISGSPQASAPAAATNTQPAPPELPADPPAATAQTTPSPPYSLGKAHNRRLTIRITLKNSEDTGSQNIRLQMPLLGRLGSPYQVLGSETFSLEPVEITEGDFRSRIAHFLIPSLPPGGSTCISVTYELKVHPITANFLAYTGGNNAGSEALFLQPSTGIESSHPEIVSRAEQITSGAKDNLEKARAIYKFVQQHMRYDSSAACRNQGALSALRQKAGVCEDYAALFVALCRAVGLPSRQVNGYADPKGTGEHWDQLGRPLSLKGCRHSWAEFYLEGMGWLPVDPTMNMASRDLKYFGSLPCSSHIAQNYFDQSVRIKFQGGRLEALWDEELG